MSNPAWPLLLTAAALEAVYVAMLLLRNLKEKVVLFIPLSLMAGTLYLIAAWLILRKNPGEQPAPAERAQSVPNRKSRRLLWIFAAGVLFRLTLLPLYPSLSDDLFRYRWDGKMMQAGYNPFELAPQDPKLQHLRDSTWQGVDGKHHVTVYGPVSELLFRWWYPVSMLPGRESLSVLLMKLPMLAFDFGVALLLMKLLGALGLARERVLVYWWAPVTVIEFAASGHNDSLAVFFLVLALLGVVAGRRTWSLTALTVATLSKLLAAFVWPVLLPAWIPAGIKDKRWRDFIWPLLVAAVVYWPFRSTLFHPVASITQYSGGYRNNDSLFGVFYALTGSPLAAAAAAGAAVAAVAGFLAGRAWAGNRSFSSAVADFSRGSVGSALWSAGLRAGGPSSALSEGAAIEAAIGARSLETGQTPPGFWPLAPRTDAGLDVCHSTFLVLGTLLMCAAQVFPWYLAWILPLLAIFPNAAWLMLSVLIFLSYNVLIRYGTVGDWVYNPTLQWLEYAPFYALLIGRWLWRSRRQSS